MDKTSLEIMQKKVNRGNDIQEKLKVLRQLREGLSTDTGLVISLPCKDVIMTIKENCYVGELYEPIKESIAEIVDHQIMMFNLEFKEL